MPIIIDITPLLQNVGNTLKIDETEEVSYPEDCLVMTRPVHIKGEITNSGEVIILEGKVETTVKLNCSRCLREFDHPMSFEIEEEYSLHPAKPEGKGKYGLKKDDFVFAVGSDNTINVSEALRQDILTEIPIKPLCDNNCPGVTGMNKGVN